MHNFGREPNGREDEKRNSPVKRLLNAFERDIWRFILLRDERKSPFRTPASKQWAHKMTKCNQENNTRRGNDKKRQCARRQPCIIRVLDWSVRSRVHARRMTYPELATAAPVHILQDRDLIHGSSRREPDQLQQFNRCGESELPPLLHASSGGGNNIPPVGYGWLGRAFLY